MVRCRMGLSKGVWGGAEIRLSLVDWFHFRSSHKHNVLYTQVRARVTSYGGCTTLYQACNQESILRWGPLVERHRSSLCPFTWTLPSGGNVRHTCAASTTWCTAAAV